MEPEEKVVYLNSQITSALIEAMGMQAENMQRKQENKSMAYNDKAFFDLIEKYGIDSNSVISYLRY